MVVIDDIDIILGMVVVVIIITIIISIQGKKADRHTSMNWFLWLIINDLI